MSHIEMIVERAREKMLEHNADLVRALCEIIQEQQIALNKNCCLIGVRPEEVRIGEDGFESTSRYVAQKALNYADQRLSELAQEK